MCNLYENYIKFTNKNNFFCYVMHNLLEFGEPVIGY